MLFNGRRLFALASLTSHCLGAPPNWQSKRDQGCGGQPISSTVDLGYSKYQGITLDIGVNQWLGIRYAAPPLGNLRWRAPQDPLVDETLQQATEFAPICVGSAGLPLSNSTNEDCLFLDVFAPANATTESRLPVWFFIQGGGYAGDEDENLNATDVVVKSNYSMIFVQINYRVGAFGFLASEKIRENGDLNVGLLDQRKALHWVQQYIYLFGGDPEHVVIHGDSAGGGSVSFQLAAYGGRDDHLFAGAIAESPFWPTHRTVPQMEFQFQRYAANVSCSDAADTLSCLRSKDTVTLQSADYVQQLPGGPGLPLWYFLPVIDGTFSQDYLYNQFEQGRFVHVPTIVGDDTNEGTYFSPNVSSRAQFLDFIKSNYPLLTETELETISLTYPQDGFGSFANHTIYFPASAAAYGEGTFTCPGIQISDSVSAYFSQTQSWNYRYDVIDYNNIAMGLGVPHVFEKPAIYGVNSTGPCDECSYETYNAAIVPVVMDYWLSFIIALDPNTHKDKAAPVWEPWNAGNACGAMQQRLKFQTNATAMEQVPSAQLARCQIWKNLADVSQQ